VFPGTFEHALPHLSTAAIDLSPYDARGVASERGQWAGTWTEPDGPMVIGGNYEAQWRGVNGLWRIQGEPFVPMRRDGGANCRARP